MKTTRRHFIKSLGYTFALSSIPFIAGCSNIRRKDLYSEKTLLSDVPFLDNDSTAILHYASLAPSGHNAQPWFVKVVNQREWLVGVNPKRKLPAVDPDDRESLLSIGTFLENLHIAASVYGYEAHINIIATRSSDETIARVKLQKSRKNNYPMKRLVNRTTVREGLLSNELKKKDIKILSQPLKGNIHYFPRGTDHATCIEEAQVESYRIQTFRKDAMEELKTWFRLNNNEATKYRDGLTLAGMGLDGFAGWYIRNFMEPADMLSNSSLKKSIDMNNELVTQGAGWFIITSNSNSVSDIVETGRKFQRMALIARDYNVALAPMNQIIEEDKGKEIVASSHKSKLSPQLIVRAGYLDKYPEPVTLRRPVNWFIKS